MKHFVPKGKRGATRVPSVKRYKVEKIRQGQVSVKVGVYLPIEYQQELMKMYPKDSLATAIRRFVVTRIKIAT